MGCGASTQKPPSDRNSKKPLKEDDSLRQLFAELDADGNGKVSLYELHAKMKADTEVQDFFERQGKATRRRSYTYVVQLLNANSTGFITYNEFKRKVQKTELRELFDMIDTDGDGVLSRDELNRKIESDYDIQEMLHTVSGNGYQYVLEQLDLNGDGVITWEEFATTLDPLSDGNKKDEFKDSTFSSMSGESSKSRKTLSKSGTERSFKSGTERSFKPTSPERSRTERSIKVERSFKAR